MSESTGMTAKPSWATRSPLAAILFGILVTEAGIIPWSIFLFALPAPWSFFVMILYLVGYVAYFSGRLPRAENDFRHERFRKTRAETGAIVWVAASFLFVVIIEASLVVNFRLMDFPSEKFLQYNSFIIALPDSAQWMFIVVASLVAGICEETGFRGYLQVPLEKRFGAATAVISSGLLFTVFHFNQPWSFSIIPSIIVAGVLLSLLAYKSQTLIFPMIAHVVMDVFNFTFWWSTVGGRADRATIFSTGVDAHFIAWVGILLISLILFLLICFRKTKPALV